jgi:hypothetical protein
MYPGDGFEIRYAVGPAEARLYMYILRAERKLLTITCRGCQLRSRLPCSVVKSRSRGRRTRQCAPGTFDSKKGAVALR